MQVNITESLAKEILTAESVCYGEGIGADTDEYNAFIHSIITAYPQLKQYFTHLPWVQYEAAAGKQYCNKYGFCEECKEVPFTYTSPKRLCDKCWAKW